MLNIELFQNLEDMFNLTRKKEFSIVQAIELALDQNRLWFAIGCSAVERFQLTSWIALARQVVSQYHVFVFPVPRFALGMYLFVAFLEESRRFEVVLIFPWFVLCLKSRQ